jgi:hypothetical protein
MGSAGAREIRGVRDKNGFDKKKKKRVFLKPFNIKLLA